MEVSVYYAIVLETKTRRYIQLTQFSAPILPQLQFPFPSSSLLLPWQRCQYFIRFPSRRDHPITKFICVLPEKGENRRFLASGLVGS